MRNRIVGTAPFGPVYARKIDIFRKDSNGAWKYYCSTNAARTCREAAQKFPGFEVLARFAGA